MYMLRNYRFLTSLLRPTMTIFLGDLMDGGREWQDPQ
jgi:ethanolamine phosphate phosphodiesterase